MGSIFGKIGKLAVILLSAVVNVANLFLGNIVIYQTTTGLEFHWELLLHSYLFWGVIIVNIVFFSVAHVENQKEQKVDKSIENVPADFYTQMYNLALDEMKHGHFDTSRKVLRELRRIQNRRRK